MTKKKLNAEDVQGTKTATERKPSKLYTMKAFRATVQKLKNLQMVSREDSDRLDKINANLLNAYLLNESEWKQEENVLDNTNHFG